MDALAVLQEIPGDAGVILWQSVRDVVLWAATSPTARAELFSLGAAARRERLAASAELDPAVTRAVGVLTHLLADPAAADPENVALACGHVARWAETNGAPGTALWFAQAAATAQPNRAAAAAEAGKVAQRIGSFAVAETWYRRAIGLARRTGDWGAYTEAWTDLGDILASRGDDRRARVHFLKAVRASRRFSLVEERRRALRGLVRLAIRRGAYDEATMWAEHAARGMHPEHPLYAEISHAFAEVLVRRGDHAAGASILKAFLFAVLAPGQRMRAAALLSLASAALGDGAAAESAWAEADGLVHAEPESAESVSALLDLAAAASLLGNAWRARDAARRALHGAERLGDPALVRAATALIDGGATAP